MASSVEQFLQRVDAAAGDVQALTDAVAEKVRQGGDVTIRASRAAYGAAAGAKAGASAPTEVPPVVKYGALALVAWFLLRRR